MKIDLIKIVPKPSSKVINSPFLKIQIYIFFAKFPLIFGLVYRELMYRRNQSRFQFPGTQPFNGLQQVIHFLLAHWFFCHCILVFLCILLIEYFHNCSEWNWWFRNWKSNLTCKVKPWKIKRYLDLCSLHGSTAWFQWVHLSQQSVPSHQPHVSRGTGSIQPRIHLRLLQPLPDRVHGCTVSWSTSSESTG